MMGQESEILDRALLGQANQGAAVQVESIEVVLSRM
jgi:hypothetical protein